jgi:hypothetical protein
MLHIHYLKQVEQDDGIVAFWVYQPDRDKSKKMTFSNK